MQIQITFNTTKWNIIPPFPVFDRFSHFSPCRFGVKRWKFFPGHLSYYLEGFDMIPLKRQIPRSSVAQPEQTDLVLRVRHLSNSSANSKVVYFHFRWEVLFLFSHFYNCFDSLNLFQELCSYCFSKESAWNIFWRHRFDLWQWEIGKTQGQGKSKLIKVFIS